LLGARRGRPQLGLEYDRGGILVEELCGDLNSVRRPAQRRPPDQGTD